MLVDSIHRRFKSTFEGDLLFEMNFGWNGRIFFFLIFFFLGEDRVESLLEDGESVLDLASSDVERRHEADGLVGSSGHEQQTVGDGSRSDLSGGSLGDLGVVEFESDHETHSTNVRDVVLGVVLQLAKTSEELGRALLDILDGLLLLKDIQGSDGSSARDDVSSVSSTHGARDLLGGELRARGDGGERHSRGETLGHDDDIGNDAKVLEGEGLSCSAEARLNLISDQQDALLVTDATQGLHEGLGRDGVTSFSEDGLNDEGRNIARIDLSSQQLIQILLIPSTALDNLSRVGLTNIATMAVGIRRNHTSAHEGTKTNVIDSL